MKINEKNQLRINLFSIYFSVSRYSLGLRILKRSNSSLMSYKLIVTLPFKSYVLTLVEIKY